MYAAGLPVGVAMPAAGLPEGVAMPAAGLPEGVAMPAAGLPEGVAMPAARQLRFPVQTDQAVSTHPQFTVSAHQPKKYLFNLCNCGSQTI